MIVTTDFIINLIIPMAKKSKKYLEMAKLVDKKKSYTTAEATELVTKLGYTKFVPSIEIAVKTFARQLLVFLSSSNNKYQITCLR